MFAKVVILVFVAGWCSRSEDAIKCFTCTNATRLPDCTQSVQCPSGSACFTNYSTVQGVRLYTLGCTSVWSCPSLTKNSTGGASIIGRSSATLAPSSPDTCSECCHTGNCNRQHCQSADPTCKDDVDNDCLTVGARFDICGEVSHAKQFCKRFCGYCNTIDGHWAGWSDWSLCDVSCGNGTMTRTRACSDPAPENGGSDCPGQSKLHKTCTKDLCPVHGGWSSWSEWGSCSVTCDVGLQRRDRTCSSPYPTRYGDHCYGDARDDRLCAPGACANGSWSSWGPWGACTRTCEGGIQTRSRNCNNPPPSLAGTYCDGEPMRSQACNISPCHGPVMFMAQHLSTTNPGYNATLVFTQVHTNVGNGYDSSTGIFTAPVAGAYSFHVQFCDSYTRVIIVGLVVNNVYKTKMAIHGDSANYSCHDMSYLAVLHAGDKVQAKVDDSSSSGNIFYQSSDFINLFSGALMR